jgi:hypothetical protein
MIADTIPEGTAIGALQGTFGNVVPSLRILLQTGKVPAFRVHLLNGPCWRNKNCEKGEPRPSDLKAIRRRTKGIKRLIREFPNVECYLSPVLEHDVSRRKLVSRWFEVIHREAPTCILVSSANTGINPKGILRERHGNSARGDVISNDGESIFDIKARSGYTGGRRLTLAWIPAANLRPDNETRFIPPSRRPDTRRLTRDDVERMLSLVLLYKIAT